MRTPFPNWIALLLLLWGCANRVQPSGGPKDTKPPEPLSIQPAQLSVGFSGNLITIAFNEYIQIKEGASSAFISPPQAEAPEFIVSGRTLNIRLKEKLLPNTTYTLNLGKSVADITEGNILQDFSLVFSTGSHIDSLQLKGQARDALTGKPVEDALIMLYEGMEDSLPRKSLPRYFAKTAVNGSFTVPNLRQGSYQVFALKEEVRNYKYDVPGELIGFPEQPVVVDTATPVLVINMFIEQEGQKLLKSNFSLPGKLDLKFSSAPDDLKIHSPGNDTIRFLRQNHPSKPDSVSFWISNAPQGRFSVVVQTDTLSDTLAINNRISAPRRGTAISSTDTILKFSSNLPNGKLLPGDTLKLIPSAPIQTIDTSLIKFKFAENISPGSIQILPSDPFSAHFTGFNEEGGSVQMTAYKGAFRDIFNRTNDTLKLTIQTWTSDELGTLELQINTDTTEVPLIVELLNSKGTVVRRSTIQSSSLIIWKNLTAETLSARIIFDENRNGIWDSGNFKAKRQPEKIIYFNKEITIRQGWDLELSWDIGKGSR